MTPRRILLLMGGLFAFGMVYAVYARLFGWLDGLPVLPVKMLTPSDGKFRPPPRVTSPTVARLKQSFGENAHEIETAYYPTQLEFRNGDTSIVVASGSPPSSPNSKRVTLSPFSIAIFSKPRPAHLLQPGEVSEVTTFHSDKAVLEFDRVIKNPTDMNSAKLVRMELISDPELAVPRDEPRRGVVHITNNQRSADPNRSLVMKTVGPVFYRDPKYATGPDQLGPDVWTDAAVEIVDRSNLPRKAGAAAATAPVAAEESRTPGAVVAILDGQRLPPPTVTAVGMRIYLEPDESPRNPRPKNPQAKRGAAGFSGVRRVELLEKVLLHLWVEGGQGALVGSGGRPSAIPEPPAAATAVAGGLVPGVHAAREFARDLLQVETRGPFNYDAEKNLARFDVLPQADPNLPNDVRVTKVPPRPGAQHLLTQVLEIEFNGPPTGNPPAKPPAEKPPTAATAGSPRFKRMHAWTYTPGRFLTVSSDADQLEAYGQDLVHEQATERTTLTGTPLYAVQRRNVLTAGGPKTPSVLIIEPAPGTTGTTPTRRNQVTVRGKGRVELFDAAANANTVTATWETSMVQTKERINDLELDLFTLTDGAKFEDVRADYWLKGKVLKLWLLPANSGEPAANPDGTTTSRTLPHRVQAIENVSGHSADLDIEHADHLNSLFRDIAPPAEPPGPAAPKEPPNATPKKGPRDPAAPPPAASPKEPKEPEKPPKPPMKLRARTIDTWVARYPLPKQPAAPGAAPNGPDTGGMKYQLEKARCEGMVSVHQDPEDPAKPRGTDILGNLMLIDSTPDGSVLTVFGWDTRPGEVHNEGTSLIGPKVVIDQLHNLAVIEGRGSVVIPASSDLTGAEVKNAEPVVIHFRDGMKFFGAVKTADFFGKVNASQGGSWVACHTMQVIFDRPIYFTQSNRPDAKPKPAPAAKGPKAKDEDKAKVEFVYCYPAPADTADSPQEKLVSFHQIDRDPQTGKPVRRQQLVASELRLQAQARDEGRGEPYRLVAAMGPGVVRTWAPGSKDDDPTGAAPPPRQPGAAPPAETEMKLTVVNFTTKMMAKDKGAVYKEATFYDATHVIHVPTDNPELAVERHKLPPRAVLLTCKEKLVVWTHKPGNDPPQQFMHAYGDAYLQNREYDGWGEVITYEGKRVVFQGLGGNLARIKSRFGGTDQAGEKITYDRSTGYSKVDGSIGGALTESPKSPPPKNPPKK